MSGPHEFMDAAAGTDESRRESDEGVRLQCEGRFDEAEARYQKALEIEPRNATALSNLGFLYTQQGRHEEAVERYRLALDIENDRSVTHLNLGLSQVAIGELAAGEASFRNAVALDGANKPAWSSLARLVFSLGRAGEAEQLWRQAIDTHPGDDEFLSALGSTVAAQGRLDEAISIMHQALGFRARAGHWVQLGLFLLVRHDLGSAEDAFRQALGLDPDNTEARRQLAMALAARGRTEDAILELERALRLDSESEARVDLGILRLSRADYTGGESLLREHVEANPRDERARYYHALALQQLERIDEARTTLEAIVQAGGPHAEHARQALLGHRRAE